MFFNYTNSDPKNVLKKRNIKNTEKRNYNCGGYALGTYSWYTPFKKITAINLRNHHMYHAIEKDAVAKILTDFPDLQLVEENTIFNKSVDYTKNEIIAFRFSHHDFHFWKISKNGRWYDKMGSSYYINSHKYFDVFENWGTYDGKLYFFTRPRA